MKKASKQFLRSVATRSVIAALPVAMVSAYASNLFVPTPPRMAAYAYQTVAEINVAPTTVGVAESPLYGETKAQVDAQLDALQALGVQNVRVFVPWGLIEPTNANTDYWSNLDIVMQAAAERNMGVLAEVNSTPTWAAAGGATGSPLGNSTPDDTDFTAFMSKFVAKYGSTVSAYEIWNEPNGALFSNPIDPAAYDGLLEAVYPVIKAADPTATVIAGALGHVVSFGSLTMDPVDFVNAMIAANPNIGNYFDALSYHPYDNTLSFTAGDVNPNSSIFAGDTAYNQVAALMALFPTKKVWLSEFGVPTYSYTDSNGVVQTITQAQQAALIENLVENWGTLSQAGPIFLYTGQDTGTGSTDPEQNYGLYTDNGDPKSVIAFLTQWFIDHPQNATSPTDPTDPTSPTSPTAPANPAAALAAFFQTIAAQLNSVIAQAQAFVTTFVNAIVKAIQSIFSPPAAQVATPAVMALRIASVESSVTPSVANVSPAPLAAAVSTPAAAAVTPATAAAVTPAAAAAVVTPEVTATVKPVVEVPAVQSAVATTPVVAAPVVTAPVVTAPVVAATPAATVTPASSNPTSSGTDAASSTKDASVSSAKSSGQGSDSSERSSDSGKKDKKDDKGEAGSDRHDGSAHHLKEKGGNDVSATSVKATSSTEGAGAGKTSAGASASSSSGSGSDGS